MSTEKTKFVTLHKKGSYIFMQNKQIGFATSPKPAQAQASLRSVNFVDFPAWPHPKLKRTNYGYAEGETAKGKISTERKTPSAVLTKWERRGNRTDYGYAKGETAEGKISNERTNQGVRARLDRQSVPKKRKEKP